MTYTPAFSITGKRIMKETESARFFVSLAENNEFQQVIEGLYDFVVDTNADCDTAYDWVCDQLDIQTFVADTYAWDMFFDVYTQATA
jgi:hypothetical protein